MQIYAIKHHGMDVIRVIRGGVMVWGRGMSMLSALASLGISGQGDLRTGAAAPMEATADAAAVDMQGTLEAPESAAASAEAIAEIETYADLYVYQAAHCAADTALTLTAQAQANAPESAACTVTENLDILAEADAHAPAGAPGSAETVMEVSAEAEANAPAVAPLSACLEWDFDIQVEATLTVASAAALTAEATVCLEHEAQADREITRYYTVRFYDGDTLLDTQQVGHGETATPPDTAKDGYVFVGWTPDPEGFAITEDTDFYGTWEEIPSDDIVPRQEIAFSTTCIGSLGYGDGRYYAGVNVENDTPFTDGKKYVVEWDGVKYLCVARTVYWPDSNGNSASAEAVIGNVGVGENKCIWAFGVSQFGPTDEPETEEPFIIRTYDQNAICIATKSNAATHTIRIYAQK